MANFVTEAFHVEGMTCGGCAESITRTLGSLKGLAGVKSSYSEGTVNVTYDTRYANPDMIRKTIESLGFSCAADSTVKAPGPLAAKPWRNFIIALAAAGIFLLIERLGGFAFLNYFPTAKQGMGLAALFVTGLLSSAHCVGMCGGICLSQCAPQGADVKGGARARIRPSLLYNLGRVTSYTVIGGLAGALGSAIRLTGAFRGTVAIFAGVFMVIMGLNMLNAFPWLRRLNIRMPGIFTRKIDKKRSPYYVGLLNGFMPCGPLQAMQLYALSSGSFLTGAAAMLMYSLGTFPLLFGFGFLSTLLNKRSTGRMMAVSAALVIVLGTSMLSSGMSLSGISLAGSPQVKAESSLITEIPVQVSPPATSADSAVQTVPAEAGSAQAAPVGDEVQTVTIDITSRAYEAITVKKGIPVRFIVRATAKTLNGCNNEIIIPKYNIDKALIPGENVIEFTPLEAGVFPYSCWMGMIRSTITVTE